MANTPLHLAVFWPYGVRELLKHGACLDASDQNGRTPLNCAIELGIPETVDILMKAGCSLWLATDEQFWRNPLSLASMMYTYGEWGVSKSTRIDVLNTVMSSLAERRRNLQSRLATISKYLKIDAGVFRGDRILDEYAEYAEVIENNALSRFDNSPRYASALLQGCPTVYHLPSLTVEIAEKLWQQGFRDIDIPDKYGLTPLMRNRHKQLAEQVDLCFWLIQKGAKLHRPQHRPLDYDADPTFNAVEFPPVTRALHYVATNVGTSLYFSTYAELLGDTERSLENQLSQLSKGTRLFPKTILFDVSQDDCICACSSRGCLASTMMLKRFNDWVYQFETRRDVLISATKQLIILIGLINLCPDWLVKEIIRYHTFEELELRHTCCHWNVSDCLIKLDPEEQAEIRDEDHEKIELLEDLLLEFEEQRRGQDVLSFLEGYWATRMDQVHQDQDCVDEEALREIGVVLQKDDTEGSE